MRPAAKHGRVPAYMFSGPNFLWWRLTHPRRDRLRREIVADISCAEGNFSLEIVERAAQVHLFEADVLNGARRTLARARDVRVAVCTYHRREDEADLAALLKELGFTPSASRGYMLFYRAPGFGPPYFRRGLLRATKP